MKEITITTRGSSEVEVREVPIANLSTPGDDPITDHRICNQEGWALFSVDSTGLLEIQRDDEAGKFDSDWAAFEFVLKLAHDGSPYHQRAILAHEKDEKALQDYRSTSRGVAT